MDATTARQEAETARATAEDARKKAETARETAETNRNTAESERERNTSNAIGKANLAAANAKADYIGDDFYVYKWNSELGKYVKSEVLC